jgi:hypothetical protein
MTGCLEVGGAVIALHAGNDRTELPIMAGVATEQAAFRAGIKSSL